MSNIILAVMMIVLFVTAEVLMWFTPDYDSLPRNDTENDGPWPDGP